MSRGILVPEEVRKRLIRLRNLEYLHEQQRFKIWHLRDENRELKKEVAQLKIVASNQQHTIDDLKLRVEELRAIVFGKKRNKKEDPYGDNPIPVSQAERIKESYRRKVPGADEITETRRHSLHVCGRCSRAVEMSETVVYFEEDIPLPQQKTVVRHVVEKGYCASCGMWSSGALLPTAQVVLGERVRRYTAYLSVICRQSYSQIQDILEQTYHFGISQGEIANILEKEGDRLRPAYERLKATIRGQPSIHLDETGWNLFVGDGYRRYAWTMTGGETDDAAFVLGKTRGKGNATDLIEDSKAVVVSDDYGAYRNLKNPHQLCCAHILRKLRDLTTSSQIKGALHAHCVSAYQEFAGIYADIETARTSSQPALSHDALHERLKTFAEIHLLDPTKLIRVKEQVGKRSRNYLTCLRHPSVASDNNAAERSLRHLVLKRKISFGSLTEKTAETLAILLSVLLSCKRQGTLRGYLMGV